MKKEHITHEKLLQSSAFGAAEKLVEIALAKKPLADTQSDEAKTTIAVHIYKLNMFMLFGVLHDSKHGDDAYFQGLTDRLTQLYESERDEGFKKAWDEVKHMPDAEKILKDSGLLDDPFEAYFEAINSGTKDFHKTPFGILAKKISTDFFTEDLRDEAYRVFAYLLPQAIVEVIRAIDKVPENFSLVE